MSKKSIDPEIAALLLQVLHKELSDDPAGKDLLARFNKAPKANSHKLSDYLKHRLEADKEFREKLSTAQELPAEMRTIISGGHIERLIQIAEADTVNIPVTLTPITVQQGIPLWTGITAVLFGVAAISALLLSILPKGPGPMSKGGFNVAVAEFAMVDSNGKVTASDVSLEFSNGLYTAIETETKRLPPALQVELRSPSDVGVVEDNEAAAEAAHDWNATMLIYGTVKHDSQGSYEVEPKFYIMDTSFSYGSEVTGPEYLGQPVTGLKLGSDQKFKSDTILNARSQALQNMIRGLAYFSIRDYGSAEDAFQDAIDTPSWDEGQEVAYFLLGTVRLRSWDLIQNPDVLPKASEAFNTAYEINPKYVRNYLSLGAVAIARAQVPNESGTGIGAVKKPELLEAIKWYSVGLNQTEPIQAYIPTKAALGLGQAYLLGYEFYVFEDAKEPVQNYFKEVVDTYKAEQVSDLGWFAAHAHAGLGRLAGLDHNWETMSDEYQQAVTILESMEPNSPKLWIARFWAMAGFAEEQQNHLKLAQKDYEKAIEIGSGWVSDEELKSWQEALDRIKKGKT